jgi:hypothetical protein
VIYESLQKDGLVDFSEATSVINNYFRTAQTVLPFESGAGTAIADLIHLNAAEASLAAYALQREPTDKPLRVLPEAASLAIWTTDSGPFFGHDPRENPGLWEVTFFSSDASKLAWLSRTHSVETLRERFDDVIADLFAQYRGQEDVLGYSNPEMFHIRAVLWRAKIAVLLDEDDLPTVAPDFDRQTA